MNDPFWLLFAPFFVLIGVVSTRGMWGSDPRAARRRIATTWVSGMMIAVVVCGATAPGQIVRVLSFNAGHGLLVVIVGLVVKLLDQEDL